jgi:hypothetical protein
MRGFCLSFLYPAILFAVWNTTDYITGTSKKPLKKLLQFRDRLEVCELYYYPDIVTVLRRRIWGQDITPKSRENMSEN